MIFVILVIICLIISLIFYRYNLESFQTDPSASVSASDSPSTSASASASASAGCDSDYYRCDGRAICDRNGDYTYGADDSDRPGNTDKCKFSYDPASNSCVQQYDGEYDDIDRCEGRWICSDSVGMCIQGPASKATSYENQSTCEENCKFIAKNDFLCESVDRTNLTINAIPTNQVKFDRKRWCEDRYECDENYNCVKRAGGEFSVKRHCERNCSETIVDPSNTNSLYIQFQSDIADLFGDSNDDSKRNEFREKLRSIIINRGDFIGIDKINLNNITQKSGSRDTVEVILASDLDSSDIINVLVDFTHSPQKINIGLTTDYHLRRAYYEVDDGDDRTTDPVIEQIIPTEQVIELDEDYILLEIENNKEKFKLITHPLKNLSSISDTSKRFVQVKSNLENSNYKKQNININLPNSIYLNKDDGDDPEYISPGDNDILYLFKTLTEDVKQEILNTKYVDQQQLKVLFENNSDFKYLIIGTKDQNNLFDILNEVYILLYKDATGNLLYKQILIDPDYYIQYMLEEKFYTLNNDSIDPTALRTQVYNRLDRDYKEELKFKSRLFSNYSENLNLTFKFNVFSESKLVDILIYNEDLSLNPDQIKCNFSPRGETLYECKQMCLENKDTNLCKSSECNELCNNCMNLDCKWNIVDYNRDLTLKPNSANIKAFAGDRAIKITWITPSSKYPINTFYIILKNERDEHLNIYVYKSNSNLNEYIISDLQNSRIYAVNLICKNKFGASELSNTESIIPEKNKSLNLSSQDVNQSQYDDAIENYYKNDGSLDQIDTYTEYKNKVSLFEQSLIINDLKNIISDKYLTNQMTNFYNVNVY